MAALEASLAQVRKPAKPAAAKKPRTAPVKPAAKKRAKAA
jgi:hypothetical protein